MIELNLLPDELRKVKKAAPVTFEIKKAVLILPAVFIILICGHIYLFAQNIINGGRLNALGKKWLGMEPQRKELEVFKREFEGFSLDTRAVQELVKKRLAWAQKLNCLSQDLPPGIWFTQMRADQKNFSLQAAVLSLQKEEAAIINKFIDSLKADAAFFGDFQSLELGPLQRKQLGGYDIVDFTLNATLKQK